MKKNHDFHRIVECGEVVRNPTELQAPFIQFGGKLLHELGKDIKTSHFQRGMKPQGQWL